MNSDYTFELNFKVRDYECDLEGIVNNANYQHYMEHTRHEFLNMAGISFAQMYANGITPVVARINISYKYPLRSGNEFVSKLRVKKQGIRYIFYQDIFLLPDMKLVAKGQVDTVCLVNGKLDECKELEKYLEPYFDKE